MVQKKRKQASGKQVASKKQKQDGQKAVSKDINVPVDDGFKKNADVGIYINSDKIIYDASLNQTNIGGNNNKFYHLQLLETKDGKEYYTHTRWGRVGEHGQVKTMGPFLLDEALKEFEKKFKDKTGLAWDDRSAESKPKKYTFIEKSYESDEEDADAEDGHNWNEDMDQKGVSVKSELPIQTQQLMELIFNEYHFNSVLEELGYNTDKLPLGKLGKSTLKKGFEHLRELASLIKNPVLSQNKYGMSQREAIEDFSNKYYSTIPHVFGRKNPPLIDNDGILRREVEMLDTLSDMEVANTIMKTTTGKARDADTINLLDKRFNDLGMEEMTPLVHNSQEYRELSKYLIESSGQTHGIRYRLQDIFRIERRGENQRFEKSKYAKLKDKDRRLLWHGSRTTNFGGILSQGLRIAPPEAPVNGYAFGKGVYFADISTKSANYCNACMSGNVGILLLCEVELSRPLYEIPTGNSNAQQEAEKHNCLSTKGVGRTVPQAWKDARCVHERLKGVTMPDGKPGPNKHHETGYLEYNEYIAYHVEQVRLRYLFRVGM